MYKPLSETILKLKNKYTENYIMLSHLKHFSSTSFAAQSLYTKIINYLQQLHQKITAFSSKYL